MAQVPKISVAGVLNQVTQSRGVLGAQVGGVDFRPEVQSPIAGTGVMLDGAEFFHDRGRRDFGFSYDSRGDQRSPPQSWSLVQTPTDTFARILESMMGEGEIGPSGTPGGGPAKRFQNVIARAISIYENNAKLIHGELSLVGSSISIRL